MDQKKYELLENGLRGYPLENLVDGWTFRVEESSSNMYRIDGTNKQGKRVSAFGIDPEKVLNDCIKKQINLMHVEELLRNF